VRSEAGFTRGIAVFFSAGKPVYAYLHCRFENDPELLGQLKARFELTEAASMRLLGQVINNTVSRSEPYEEHDTKFHDLGEGHFWASGRAPDETGPSYGMDYDGQGLSLRFYKLPLTRLLRGRLWDWAGR
jgi:hypothetical protein